MDQKRGVLLASEGVPLARLCTRGKGQERKIRSEVSAMHIPWIWRDDEFDYGVWDLVDKKVFQSRDIVFMEDMTIAD